ncbi:MAG: GTP cyclohydrolase I FolE [Clostridium sp.]|nr:GTP cyclohydrolase I FolE [Clostridium sp.]
MEFRNPDEESLKTISRIAAHYEEILRLIGEDPSREGLAKTPMRAAKALWDITRGYSSRPEDVVNNALFESPGSGMITVGDIEFYSLCEHHILPFFGTMSIGYIPDGRMIGLSKLARIVDLYARRLQVQERLGAEVCRAVEQILRPKGVIVRCRAEHLCMKMRGVEKQESYTDTLETAGVFSTDPDLRREFLDTLSRRR